MKTFFSIFSIISFMGLYSEANITQNHECGTKGSVKERIQNCKTTCTYTSDKKPNTWNLITQLRTGFEIWYHKDTNTIWADRSYDQHKTTYYQARNTCYDLGLFQNQDDDTFWNLPSKKDVKQALRNGIKSCLPRLQSAIWVRKTPRKKRGLSHFIFYGAQEKFFYENPNNFHHFRCILKKEL